MDSSELIRFDSMSTALSDDLRSAEEHCIIDSMLPTDAEVMEQVKIAMGGVDETVAFNCIQNDACGDDGLVNKNAIVNHLLYYMNVTTGAKLTECFEYSCFRDTKVKCLKVYKCLRHFYCDSWLGLSYILALTIASY